MSILLNSVFSRMKDTHPVTNSMAITDSQDKYIMELKEMDSLSSFITKLVVTSLESRMDEIIATFIRWVVRKKSRISEE